jgi:hypothetical protein
MRISVDHKGNNSHDVFRILVADIFGHSDDGDEADEGDGDDDVDYVEQPNEQINCRSKLGGLSEMMIMMAMTMTRTMGENWRGFVSRVIMWAASADVYSLHGVYSLHSHWGHRPADSLNQVITFTW